MCSFFTLLCFMALNSFVWRAFGITRRRSFVCLVSSLNIIILWLLRSECKSNMRHTSYGNTETGSPIYQSSHFNLEPLYVIILQPLGRHCSSIKYHRRRRVVCERTAAAVDRVKIPPHAMPPIRHCSDIDKSHWSVPHKPASGGWSRGAASFPASLSSAPPWVAITHMPKIPGAAAG